MIEQIGSCFPSRFPQQMMKNLSESAELQQEFHLYRLQQLDQSLQEKDQVSRTLQYYVQVDHRRQVSSLADVSASLVYMIYPENLSGQFYWL